MAVTNHIGQHAFASKTKANKAHYARETIRSKGCEQWGYHSITQLHQALEILDSALHPFPFWCVVSILFVKLYQTFLSFRQLLFNVVFRYA